MNKNKSRISNEQAVEFISEYSIIFYQNITHLSSFIENGFLKDLFDKNPSKTMDKAQLLIEIFGDAANSTNFTSQV
jgi:hypothetical protein